MNPCPVDGKGRHDFAAVIPESSEYDMTLYCQRCGAMRRVPVYGAMVTGSLDGMNASTITSLVGDWETR